MSRENPSPDRILETGFDFFASKTLLTAVKLGVFTELAKAEEPLSEEELAEHVGLHPRASEDFLDSLVALRFLQREESYYSNTPETLLFLDERKSTYVGDLLTMANDRLYPMWGSLTESLQTGTPQNELKTEKDSGEESVFEIMYENNDKQEQFQGAMSALSMGASRAIGLKFPWDQYDSVCDLGTSEGMFLAQVIRENPHLEGVGVDLPRVRPYFDEFIESTNVSERVRFKPVDFFEDSLPDAEVYVLGHILADWPLQKKQFLIEKVYESLPDGGAIIVYGSMIDAERRANEFGLMMSLNMLLDSAQGSMYTYTECQEWLLEAGFTETTVTDLPGPEIMVTGHKSA